MKKLLVGVAACLWMASASAGEPAEHATSTPGEDAAYSGEVRFRDPPRPEGKVDSGGFDPAYLGGSLFPGLPRHERKLQLRDFIAPPAGNEAFEDLYRDGSNVRRRGGPTLSGPETPAANLLRFRF